MRADMSRPLRLVAAAALATAMVATATPASAAPFPEVIALPNGWQPEGIAEGPGTIMYSGSRASGDIVAVDIRTGTRETVVDAPAGRTAVGIEADRFGRFWVAGGATGDVFVYNADGTPLRTYDFASTSTFINDVVVTKDAAWFTDSQQPVLYKIPIARNGALGDGVTVPLSGDYQHMAGFNLNGIDATRNGQTLVAVQSGAGVLYRIDAATGEATRIDLGGATVVNGDGVLLHGRKLYVVQNRLNKITVIRLDRTFTSGRIVDTITSPQFDVPTTMARFGNRFYLVNARFTTAATPDTPYWITAVRR
jgi:sugar lactone lactonase YvrE